MLVQKAQNGDTQAFAELYSLVYKDLYRTALLSLGHEADASDVVSDTVLDAYKTIRKLRDPSSFRSWMMTILTVKIKNKQKEYMDARSNEEDIDDLREKQPDTKKDHFGSVELTEAMAKLSEEERTVMTLNIVSGYTSEEIENITGIAANTVRSKIKRAKEKLKKYLE